MRGGPPPADRRGAPLRRDDVVLLRCVVLDPDPGGPYPHEIVVQARDEDRLGAFTPVFAVDAGLVEKVAAEADAAPTEAPPHPGETP